MKKILTLALTLAPLTAFAEDIFQPGPSTVDSTTKVFQAIQNITNWMFSGFLVIAVIMVLVAAFTILTAQGNTEKFTTAKKMITYAVIAVVIAILAKSIIMVAASLVGANVDLDRVTGTPGS